MTSDRRIVFVHAHPDDESIGTGATMARYAAEGAHVTLVTCTLGEEGEVLVPSLAGLAAGEADQLGGYRIGELSAACATLGVTDHRYLGGAGRFRDSGMMGLPTNDHPRAFWRADLDAAAGLLVEILRAVRPQVLVTYDENGLYGHPDHIQAHRVAMRAVELAGDAAPEKVYWTTVSRSVLAAGFDRFASSAGNPFAGLTGPDDLPFGVADDEIAASIDARPFLAEKVSAMRAHATQVADDSWLYELAGLGESTAKFAGYEHYLLVRGRRGVSAGRELDLFAGLSGSSDPS